MGDREGDTEPDGRAGVGACGGEGGVTGLTWGMGVGVEVLMSCKEEWLGRCFRVL